MKRVFVLLALLTVVVALPGAAGAAGQFTFLQAGFTQDLYATAPGFFGGVAFAPNGDVWTDFCAFGGSGLDRFDHSATTPVNGSNPHNLVVGSPFASNAGCGLTNHPDGFMYSNTGSGVTQLNAGTGAATGVVFGAPGDALGITVDPVTNNLVYVASDGTILTAPPGGASSTFSTVTTGSFIDGIAFDPTGTYLFVSNRTLNTVTIINRSGGLVQNSGVISGVPDGISFHATAPKFVVTNNNDGSMTRLDFPGDDYTMPPTLSLFASGGFRGDLTQVGPDGCIYLTQDGTRYDDGTSSSNSSIVHICPGFAPPPGVGGTPLNPGTTTCNGVYNGTGTDVIVPSGAVCTLAAGTIVTHDVKVEPGGTLIDLGAAIGHDINANSPKGMQIAGGTVGHDLKINGLNGSPPTGHNYVCSTTVSHDLVVTNGTAAAGSIDIGDPPDCSAGNQVGHDLNVQGNANHVDVSENGTAGTPIGHDLIVRNNTPGGATVTHNYAGNNATCSGNSPQAGAGNHAVGTNTCPA